MKKQAIMAFFAAMAVSFTAAEAALIGSVSETTTGVPEGRKKITVEGEVSVKDNGDIASGAVTLTVFKKDIGTDVSAIDPNGDPGQIEYTYQTTADKSGKYSFSFVMEAETGEYLLRVGSASGENETKVWQYLDPGDQVGFEKEIKEIYEKKNDTGYDAKAALLALLDKYSKKHFLDIPAYNRAYDGNNLSLLEFAADHVLSSSSAPDEKGLCDRFSEGYVLGMMDNTDQDGAEAFFSDDICMEITGLDKKLLQGLDKDSAKTKSKIYSKLSGVSQKGKTIDDLKNDIYNAVVFSELDGYLWQGNQAVLEKYDSITGISFDKYNALSGGAKKNAAMTEFTKALSGINDISGLKPAFDRAVENAKDYSDRTSSPGGSGGDSRTKTQKTSSSGGAAVIPAISAVTGTAEENEEEEKTEEIKKYSFSDIASYGWAVPSIERLAEKKIISGDGDGRFRPQDNVTREEFVKMMILALDLGEKAEEISFKDVTPDKWYYNYIRGAVYYHLVNGISDDMFGTGKSIKRADVALILDRLLTMYGKEYSVKDIVYSDVLKDTAGYAYDAIYRVAEAKLMTGTSETRFEPMRGITRAEAAVVADRLMKLLENN